MLLKFFGATCEDVVASAHVAKLSASRSGSFGRARLALELGTDGRPPSEFRLFTAGWNETENGRFLFDAEAAAATMAAYRAWGVDLAIDLEHQMIDDAPSPDPTAKDARGWCNLELRADGSLWAVNVKWTADGAARLTQKRQRYVSPFFGFDPETKRVMKVVNIAITAMPATHDTPALMAAHTKVKTMMSWEKLAASVGMTIDELLKVCKALGLDPSKVTVADAMAKISGDPDAQTEDAPPPVGDGGADESTEMAADPNAAPPEEKKPDVVAASARLMRLTGKSTFVEAVTEVEVWRTSHIELETERQKLAAERATLEMAERRKLCVELVTLGAEFPATVWADPLKPTALKSRWLSMPIAELRTHVTEQRAARPNAGKTIAEPPRGGETESGGKSFVVNGKTIALSASELEACAEMGAKPEDYAANKAVVMRSKSAS